MGGPLLAIAAFSLQSYYTMEEFLELCSQELSLTKQQRRERVLSLLESGRLNPQQRHGNGGWHPLHYAAQFGRGEVVEVLVSRGRCEPNSLTKEGRYTALHVACEHGQLGAVEALCQFIPDGTPAVRDRQHGNTPLHVACGNGSLDIVKLLTRKYSKGSMRELNRAGFTPLGLAVTMGHSDIAKFFMSRDEAVGNPASIFPDFREVFPAFRHRQSLDHPVSIFVMGNRQTGKSSFIRSVQTEGFLNRAIGAFWPTTDVDYHSGGIIPIDVSSYGYGRAKFYELASCRQSTQENIFSYFSKNGKAIFIITISFREELSEMEANLLYWLSFIRHQFRSSTMPYVAVVGSFLFYYKVGGLRLSNHHRLHIVYHRVLSANQELCSHFHFLGKFSMDCRLSESPGLSKLRRVIHRNCRDLRASGGEGRVPSSCYVLLSAMKTMRPGDSEPPVVRFSEVQQMVSQQSSTNAVSLFSLLPTPTDNPEPGCITEDIHSLLVKLEERKAVLVLRHLDSEDPWVIFDELKLITQIDGALIDRAKRLSVSSYLNPAVMTEEKLIFCLYSLASILGKDVLFNLLHHFMIMEVMARGDTKYFLPSVLHISLPTSQIPIFSWKMDDPNYTLGFSQCIVPQPGQVIPAFMPRFLYFLLYEIFALIDDCDTVAMSHCALQYEIEDLLQVYITIDSTAIVVNMRCSENGIFSCLKMRNQLDSIIHQQRDRLQPNMKVTEYVVPLESLTFPVMSLKHILKHGIEVNTLITFFTTKSAFAPAPASLLKLQSYEPYEWLSKLQKPHLESLLDHRLTNVQVGKSFIKDLAKCVGDNWELLLQSSDTLQSCDTSPPSDGPDTSSGPEIYATTPEAPEGQEPPTYRVLLDLFSSLSIFQSDLASVLKVRNSCTTAMYVCCHMHGKKDVIIICHTGSTQI